MTGRLCLPESIGEIGCFACCGRCRRRYPPQRLEGVLFYHARERVDVVLGKKLVLPWWGRKKNTELEVSPKGLPHHVGIIMDGNGRWATARGLPRVVGHRQGAEALREIVRECGRLAIPILTVYAFSTENWQRPQAEVDFLMELLLEVLTDELETLHGEGVRIVPIGQLGDLPKPVRDQVEYAATLTASNENLKLNMAISYGSRQEILKAVESLIDMAVRGELTQVTEMTIAKLLYTAEDPDPDLIIRTGGERRLSNFLLWQSAYSELYFSDVMWPDFTKEEFQKALVDYQKRERRFGKIDENE